MLVVAIVWAIIGYTVYLLGVGPDLPPTRVLEWLFVAGVVFSGVWLGRSGLVQQMISESKRLWRSGRLEKLLLVLASCQFVLDIMGAVSPELSFDALWYHLTLPKLYLSWGRIMFPVGNLLQSGLPRLGEMWYTLALAVDGSAVVAKVLHLLAGLVAVWLIYIGARRFSSSRIALAMAVSWFTMLSVGWLSTAAYVDFFSVVLVLLAVEKLVEGRMSWGGLLFGLAASVKFVFFLPAAFASLWVLTPGLNIEKRIRGFVGYWFPLLFVLVPWWWVSWLKTGDFLYPLLKYQPESVVGVPLENLGGRVLSLVLAPWWWTVHPDTPISPIYLALLPMVFVGWRKFNQKARAYFVLGAIFTGSVWFIPEFSNRYLLPGLAILSIVWGLSIELVRKELRDVMVFFIVVAVGTSVAARTIASRRFVPYLLGVESSDQFLRKNLNFAFGDYFDNEGKIANLVGPHKVLVTGIHNLFYVDFPFEHISWVRTPQEFRYVLVGRDGTLPAGYLGAKMVYSDDVTGARLFVDEKKE